MGARDNDTKYEPEPERLRPGTDVASAGPPFQILQVRAKINPFWPKSPQYRGIVATLHMQLDFDVPEGRLPNMSANRPQKALKSPKNLCTLAADSPKPKTGNILGYAAQNTFSRAPNPHATTHFWWFPCLQIALLGP